MTRRHRWSTRQREKWGPLYRTHSVSVAQGRGGRHTAGDWHLKLTRRLSVNLQAGTYRYDNKGPGSVTGPVPCWSAVRALLGTVGLVLGLIALVVLGLICTVLGYVLLHLLP